MLSLKHKKARLVSRFLLSFCAKQIKLRCHLAITDSKLLPVWHKYQNKYAPVNNPLFHFNTAAEQQGQSSWEPQKPQPLPQHSLTPFHDPTSNSHTNLQVKVSPRLRCPTSSLELGRKQSDHRSQPINQSTNQQINQPTNQPIKQASKQATSSDVRRCTEATQRNATTQAPQGLA